MKKITYVLSFLITTLGYSQIGSNNGIVSSITNSNILLDGSTNFSTESGAGANTGKGIIIPSVDLVNFEFDLTLADSFTFPTFFDGMIVYNNTTGNTLTSGNRSSTSTDVAPGFYYFSNPTGSTTYGSTGDNIVATASGVWTPLGSDNVKNYTTTPIKTATSIDGAQVWAVKGSFVSSGTSALVSIIMPTGMSGYYKMTTYQGGKTFRSDISEFKMITTVLNTDNVITGNGLFSEVYPAGTYDYTLEYFK